ncbi:hypothetical protein EVAR_59520_1 [Eumeta japonica]|uniref:Uncharacterized protein n=1 Tax=Eumeta variegata TaxID=151549 RepID=A0A4C1XUU8_EUMVA|nr:hypothetical protein EVAR_59520_1 [Eumeta japonica]
MVYYYICTQPFRRRNRALKSKSFSFKINIDIRIYFSGGELGPLSAAPRARGVNYRCLPKFICGLNFLRPRPAPARPRRAAPPVFVLRHTDNRVTRIAVNIGKVVNYAPLINCFSLLHACDVGRCKALIAPSSRTLKSFLASSGRSLQWSPVGFVNAIAINKKVHPNVQTVTKTKAQATQLKTAVAADRPLVRALSAARRLFFSCRNVETCNLCRLPVRAAVSSASAIGRQTAL